MTLAYWCVLIAGLLPYVAMVPARMDRAIDNHAPRDRYALQHGRQKRAYAAHLNSFEAFPFFAAAVIIAHQLAAPQAWLNGFAALFIVARVVYILAYWANQPTLRSTLWTVGVAATLAIFLLPPLSR